MSRRLDLSDPIAVLLAVHGALERAGIRCATYGGLALAAYGAPRETKDADLAVTAVVASDAGRALQAAGIDFQLAFEHVRFGGHRITRFTLLGAEADAELNTAYLVEPRSARYAREALARSMEGALRGEDVRLLAPEDFVLFKILSTRDRDLEDATVVLRSLGSQMDVGLVEREVAALSAEIADHDVAGRWRRAAQSR